MTARGITVIGASAGSGKTFRLTKEVTDALTDTAAPIDVTGLVAVTFTRKAHTELEARIRQKLVRAGAYKDALRLPMAYVGTVHAVALRLLQEFAIEAGLSPSVNVIAGNETKLLRQAFEQTLDEPTRERLDRLAARVELHLDPITMRTDWLRPCADIMDLARSNRIPPADLPAMAKRSFEGLARLLPPPVRDGYELDDQLAVELEIALGKLGTLKDLTGLTANAIKLVQSSLRKLRDGELRWSGWAKLAAITPSKRADEAVARLRLAAARYEEHPRFHGDLRAMTDAIFGAARAGLIAYQAWKQERHVVDYVDMLDGALTLLETPHVQAELAQRLQLVVVDEFQDTSPIQLALFMKLHELARRSVWVGDRKQCIFEYAGADPMLMDAVSGWVNREGGSRDRLARNHRSRPELVDLCSELFAGAFAGHGFTREEVVVTPQRTVPLELAMFPPLGLWKLAGRNKHDDVEGIADGIRRLLEHPEATRVIDRTTGMPRDLRPSDIAVLTATNQWAGDLAASLHARGIRAATARAGLLDTPEGTLVDAALRWFVDPHDELAAANIDALTGFDGATEDDWLANRLREVGSSAQLTATASWRASLEPLREKLSWVSPTEALDLVLAALDVVHLCGRWPDAPLRVANLDSLRSIAENYEERCAQERESGTVAGLLRYFDDIRAPVLVRDEVLPSDDQYVPTDDGAVVICTYHKSKGLEWPVVILANLDRTERRDAFDVAPETDATDFDPASPLAGRHVRYWVWPFGASKNTTLGDRAEGSAEGRAVSEREARERARLLYVGFTRARDHLVLAIRASKGKTGAVWLDGLTPDKLLKLPFDGEDVESSSTEVGPLRIATRTWTLAPGSPEPLRASEGHRHWFERRKPLDARLPYRIQPSGESAGWPELDAIVASSRIERVERFMRGVALRGRPTAYDALGQAVHGFLAADIEGLTPEARLERASRLIDGWGVGAHLDPPSLLEAGDSLRRWVEARWPHARWHREWPIEGAIASKDGERRVSGIIDLLLEIPEGFILVDHKSFPAPNEAAWRTKCATFIPQLTAYELLIRATQPKPVLETWIHLPVAGGMVHFRRPHSGM